MAGRPRKEIDLAELEKLSKLSPTYAEIAAFFEVSEDTITRRMGEVAFAEAYKRGKEAGKISLRRAMWKSALEKGNIAMQIFLSKNLLGMRDKFPDEEHADAKQFAAETVKLLKGMNAVTANE